MCVEHDVWNDLAVCLALLIQHKEASKQAQINKSLLRCGRLACIDTTTLLDAFSCFVANMMYNTQYDMRHYNYMRMWLCSYI